MIPISQSTMAPPATAGSAPDDGSMLAEVAHVDHRIGQRLECVMQPDETFEPEQQAAEFILPTEHALNGIKPFLEDFSVE
jgi:hypothetical protein